MNSNVEAFYPLSSMQQGMLFHTLYAPESGVYLDQTYCLLQGALNITSLERAWQQAIDRHPSLRTAFLWDGLKEPVQVVHRKVQLSIEQQDWRGLPPSETDERLKAYVREHKRRGLELSKPPLMRLALMRTGEETYWFVWSRSHLLLDGWSGSILLKEVFAFYEAYSRGQELSLEKSRPYRDYILWLKRQDMNEAENFWRQTLKGFTAPTQLHLSAPPSGATQSAGDYTSYEVRLSPSLTAALSAMAREHYLTFNTIVQGAWALLLSHYSGQKDVVFGATVSGRPSDLPGIESMVGLFINTLPVRVRVEREATVVGWLKELQFQQIEARQYEYSPLVQVQGWSDVPRGHSLFETLLVFENYPLEEAAQGQEMTLEVSDFHIFEQTNYPLTLGIAVRPELMFSMMYDSRLFDDATVKRILGHLEALLEGFARDERQRLDALSPLTDTERRQLLTEWNQTTTAFPEHQCVHELFEEQAARTPDAIAVACEDEQLTYGELNGRANQLARHLHMLGVAPEVLVGVLMERSIEMVVALLAVLKAGGAYVPLDPAYPHARLEFMLEDADVTLLLTQKSVGERLRYHRAEVICLDELSKTIVDEDDTNPFSESNADSLAYVMYTSGSTGRPKGVAVAHRSIVRLVKNTNYASFTRDEVFLQFATISFDASTFEIWGSLLNGARLALMPAGAVSLDELAQTLKRYQVTTLWLSAGLFHLMVDTHLDDLKGLKQLLAGGDVLSVPHVKKVLQELKGCRLINGYGPTENTTFTCCFPVADAGAINDSVPIGRAISNTQVYILDRYLNPAPVGVPGELYIGGDGLARGYLNRPELTAERFISDPFNKKAGARLYKTGDLVRYRRDGEIEFLGRLDGQVKVRGYRIELAEVETVLAEHESVREAVVVARKDQGDKHLAAYVVPRLGKTPNPDELRTFLQRTLPEYMVPSVFVIMEELPLTPNGKVDRRALPAPGESRTDAEKVYVAPRNQTEELLVGIWSEVLGIEKIGISSSFFDLGGHSLLAMRIITRVREVFNVKLPLPELFVSPDIARLAELIENLQAQQETIDVKPAAKIRRRNRNPEQQFAELDKLSETEAKERVLVKLQTK